MLLKDNYNRFYTNLIVTGTIDDPFYVSSEENTPKRHSVRYYKHKFLLKLRKKRFENNYDLGLYFLIKFGGPTSTIGSSLLRDDELLECSMVSTFTTVSDLDEWYRMKHYDLQQGLKKNSTLRNMSISQMNRKLARQLPGMKWFNHGKLYEKVLEQSSWNPFSIFGSSLPYVSVNDIFNRELSQYYVCGNLKRKISKEIGCKEDDNENILTYLTKRWLDISHKNINWLKDPLIVDEVLWYLNATGKYLDKSASVCILQKCYCVTPNPKIRYNWNDQRYSMWRNYNGPRPSMGEALSPTNYNKSVERFIKLSRKHTNHNDGIKDQTFEYYRNYFNHNQVIKEHYNNINLSCQRKIIEN